MTLVFITFDETPDFIPYKRGDYGVDLGFLIESTTSIRGRFETVLKLIIDMRFGGSFIISGDCNT